jgi:hypothetical protein
MSLHEISADWCTAHVAVTEDGILVLTRDGDGYALTVARATQRRELDATHIDGALSEAEARATGETGGLLH